MAKCSICHNDSELAKANLSRKTGDRLYRTWCLLCEKTRKDLWRAANIEKHNARSRKWTLENPKKKKQSSKKYSELNPEMVKEYHRVWKLQNKSKVNLSTALRRHRIRQATPKSPTEFDRLFFHEIYDLAQRRNLEVDHMIPLDHPKVCGLHTPSNLQLLTKHDNCVKSNRWLNT